MKFRTVVLLITILVAVGQLANTIFVPAIKMIADTLNVNPSSIQAFMSGYLLPYGISQFIYGPLADKYGRKPVIMAGLVIFAIGTVFSAIGTSFGIVLLGCILQGTGAGVGGMVFRTVMRDCFTGNKLQKANSIMAMVVVFPPLLAPVIGSGLAICFGWRAIFIFLFIVSVAVFFFELKYLKETRPAGAEAFSTMEKYRMLFREPSFMPYALCLALGFGGISVFEASLGVIMSQVFHLTPEIISLIFILPCPFFLIGSYVAGRMSSYYTMNTIMFAGILGALGSSLFMLLPGLIGFVNLPIVIVPLCFYMFAAGMLAPTATTGALDPLGDIAGTAGAATGGIQNIGAGFFTMVSSLLPQTSQIPLAIILTIVSCLMLYVYLNLIRNKKFSHMERVEATVSDFP